jgi:hypothetical protein
MVQLGEVNPMVWEKAVDGFVDDLEEDGVNIDKGVPDWLHHANSMKRDRELFDKYGHLKGLILNPTFQYYKQYVDHYVEFDIVLGDPFLPLTTALIVLFMLHKRISNMSMIIVSLFIFNVNPLYVCISALVYWLLIPKRKPRLYRWSNSTLSKQGKTVSIGTNSESERKLFETRLYELAQQPFDHILIGRGDLGTLYTAALLSRMGHRCCVIQPAGQQIALEVSPIVFYLYCGVYLCAAELLNIFIFKSYVPCFLSGVPRKSAMCCAVD